MSESPLLEVRDLTVSFPTRRSVVSAVRGVSFHLQAGQRLGLLGESGSGKTLTALALMRLLPRRAVVSGSVLLQGRDLLQMDERDLIQIRGRRIAMVFQNPMTALNPVRRIGDQLVEAIRAHGDFSSSVAHGRAIDLLNEVGVSSAEHRLRSYPHEFSGGMRQRVVIAIALAGNPQVIIADEATTALDVTTQARVISLLKEVAEHRNVAIIFVTHDLAVASTFCTDVLVMYAGRIVERSPAAEFYVHQVHPYAEALVSAICSPALDPSVPIRSIPGQPPTLGRLPVGCSFQPRCPIAIDVCSSVEPPTVVDGIRAAECHRAPERQAGTDART